MTTLTITLEADATGRVIPGVPETPPAYSHGGLPPEPAHVEDLRITLRLPARCVSKLDARGYVEIDLTDIVSERDTEKAEQLLIDEADSERGS